MWIYINSFVLFSGICLFCRISLDVLLFSLTAHNFACPLTIVVCEIRPNRDVRAAWDNASVSKCLKLYLCGHIGQYLFWIITQITHSYITHTIFNLYFSCALVFSSNSVVFWFGDLNFRIEDYDIHVVKSAIDSSKLSLLWERDQVSVTLTWQ